MCTHVYNVLWAKFIGWFCFFFFKQKTAYEIVSRDWSSDVCSSDLRVSWRRGIFILQMSTLLVCEKLRDFSANEIELKTKSVCFDEIHANFWAKDTNS